MSIPQARIPPPTHETLTLSEAPFISEANTFVKSAKTQHNG
jgi:hypothetical protein